VIVLKHFDLISTDL